MTGIACEDNATDGTFGRRDNDKKSVKWTSSI